MGELNYSSVKWPLENCGTNKENLITQIENQASIRKNDHSCLLVTSSMELLLSIPYFLNNIPLLEKNQRRVTKIPQQLRRLKYEEMSRTLGLTSLKY